MVDSAQENRRTSCSKTEDSRVSQKLRHSHSRKKRRVLQTLGGTLAFPFLPLFIHENLQKTPVLLFSAGIKQIVEYAMEYKAAAGLTSNMGAKI